MSIEERIRTGLAASTDRLTSDLEIENELRTVLRRAHHRRQARAAGLAVAAAAVALAVIAWAGGGVDLKRSDGPPDPVKPPKVTLAGPRSMEGIDGALEAGSWKVPVFAAEYKTLPWAVVEVPAGYGSPGGWTVDRGADGDPDHYGSVDFWSVGDVVDDPCHATTGSDPGPSVRDLADALHRQTGHPATAPVPVRLDGYSGLYLEITGPNAQQLAKCTNDTFTLWRSTADFPSGTNVPGTVFHLWILDVDGDRIVVNEDTTPHENAATKAEVRAIAESTHFVDPDERS